MIDIFSYIWYNVPAGGAFMTDEQKARKREYDKTYRETHKEQIRKIHKAWRDKNSDHVKEKAKENYRKNPKAHKARMDKYKTSHTDQVREANHKYKVENRQKCTDYQRQKRQSDPVYRFRSSFTSLMSIYKRKTGYTGNMGTWEMVGCNFETFLAHIQSQFTEGMTLENYGSGIGKWSIDHIEPIRNAKCNEDVERVNHYTNLRPMWNTENSSRAGKSLGKPVYCIELDRTFESASTASRELGLHQTNISGCCNGKRFKTAGGYHWQYVK